MKEIHKNERIDSRCFDPPTKSETSLRYPSPSLNRSVERVATNSMKESVPGRLLSGVVGVAEVFLRGSSRATPIPGSSESSKHSHIDEAEANLLNRSEESPENNKDPRAHCSSCPENDPVSPANSEETIHASSALLYTSAEHQYGPSESPVVRYRFPTSSSAWNMRSHAETNFRASKTAGMYSISEGRKNDSEGAAHSEIFELSPKIDGLQTVSYKNQRLGGMVGSAVTLSSGVVEGIRNSVPSLPSASMFTWAAGRGTAEEVQRLEEQNMALQAEVCASAVADLILFFF